MIIYHHNDDDGRCAAAIVHLVITNLFAPELTTENFIEYDHEGVIKHPDWDSYVESSDVSPVEINKQRYETVYILDIALSNVIHDLIQDCLKHSCRVVYIDHHKTTLDYIKEHPEFESILNNASFSWMHKTGISACLLTWVYTCMNDEEKSRPDVVDFDLAVKRSHVMVHNIEYRIPMAVRYIDDNDVWRHKINETRMFREGFKLEEDKSPSNLKLWIDLIYKNINCSKYVDSGQVIERYNKITNKELVDGCAFEHELDGIKVLCLNNAHGNSDVFGDKFHEYPAVVKYVQVGLNKWKYTMYSTEHPVEGVEPVDVSEIAKKYGGGGHEHAAGFSLPYNLFYDTVYVANDKGNATKDYVESFKKQYRPIIHPGA